MKVDGTTEHVLAAAAWGGPGDLRYLMGGAGSPVLLLHTVRTQAEHFHRLIPLLLPHHTVYALDFPGMGHSEKVAGGRYDEPEFRAAVIGFITTLDLWDVTLVGESMGATVAMSAAPDLPGRVRRIVASNPYDYAGGLARSGPLARIVTSAVLAPGFGAAMARIEPKPALRMILRGGLIEQSALTNDYLDELAAVGARPGYPVVARAVMANLPTLIAARARYTSEVPVRIIYGEHDWSRRADRRANESLLPQADFVHVPNVGHFIALERPDLIAAAVLG